MSALDGLMVTNDYAKFKTFTGNRDLNTSHVKKLKESLADNNLMQYQPILVTKDFHVIDGQHRLQAAKEMKLPVHYIVVPDASLETVQQLNSNLRSWSVTDFVESYAKLGKKPYIELLKFMSDYGFPVVMSAEMLAGDAIGGEKTGLALRNGTFTIRNMTNAMNTVKRLKDLQPFCDAKVWRKPEFIRVLIRLYGRGVDHSILVEQLKKTGKRLTRQASARDYFFHILDVYNYGLKKNRIDAIDIG